MRHALKATNKNSYDAWLLVLAGALIFFTLYFSRTFALRVHARASRAEENLRHFSLTGKLLHNRLSLRQVIGFGWHLIMSFRLWRKKQLPKNGVLKESSRK